MPRSTRCLRSSRIPHDGGAPRDARRGHRGRGGACDHSSVAAFTGRGPGDRSEARARHRRALLALRFLRRCADRRMLGASYFPRRRKKPDGFRCGSIRAPRRLVPIDEKRIVYILRSESDARRHFVGITTDPWRELLWHNAGSCRHTVQSGPWSMIVSMEFVTERAARRFARYLKTGSGRAFARRHFASIE